jgi:hypothetical protein
MNPAQLSQHPHYPVYSHLLPTVLLVEGEREALARQVLARQVLAPRLPSGGCPLILPASGHDAVEGVLLPNAEVRQDLA